MLRYIFLDTFNKGKCAVKKIMFVIVLFSEKILIALKKITSKLDELYLAFNSKAWGLYPLNMNLYLNSFSCSVLLSLHDWLFSIL